MKVDMTGRDALSPRLLAVNSLGAVVNERTSFSARDPVSCRRASGFLEFLLALYQIIDTTGSAQPLLFIRVHFTR